MFSRLAAAVLGCLTYHATVPQTAEAGARLGTHRTITISPKRHSQLMGYEGSLGLRDKEVILTFDDGPLGSTQLVLNALRRHGSKATFFMVGRMAANNPGAVRRVRSAGHTVAHHSWNHERLPGLSAAEQERSIDRGIAAVQKASHGSARGRTRVPFFRAPYLAQNGTTKTILRRKGLVSIGANIDSLDWKKQSSSALHDRIMQKLRAKRKGILLLHDIQPRTAKMLPRLLNSMAREGYKVVHMVPGGSGAPVSTTVLASLDKSAASKDGNKKAGKKRFGIRVFSEARAKRIERRRAKSKLDRSKLRKSKSYKAPRRKKVRVKRVARVKLRSQFIFN